MSTTHAHTAPVLTRLRWPRRSTPYTLAEALRSLIATMGIPGWCVAVHDHGIPSHVFLKVPQSVPFSDAYWLARCSSAHGYDVAWRGVRNGCNLFKLEEVVQPEVFG